MRLIEFTAIHVHGPEKVSHIRMVVSDHPDLTKRTEWIDVQIAIDEPTNRNGAIQRVKALEKVRDEISRLISDFQRLSDQSR